MHGITQRAIKYVGPVVIYKIIEPHNYLLMTLDGKFQEDSLSMRD